VGALTDTWRSTENRTIFLSLAESALRPNLEPIVDARSGQLVACEALMRGAAELGFAHPHAVLDHAHRIGALIDLEIMLACKAIDSVIDLGQPRPRLFLNIDGRTLPDWQTFRNRLLYKVQSENMSPAEICLEISEVQQVLEGEDLSRAIEGLRGAGFSIAVDDFGTGVSGLQMLYHARPNFLKVDRFFVQAMPTDAHKRLLVRAIAQLAHTLGARVIAEGVETEDELMACRQADCGLIQGYLVKSPDADFDALQAMYDLPGKLEPGAVLDRRLHRMLQSPTSVTPDVPLQAMFELYHSDEVAEVLPVVSDSGMLVGGILWNRLRPLLGARYGMELAKNRSFAFPVQDLIEQVPTIDIRQPLASALDLVADKARHGVIVVDRGHYRGYLSPYDMMQLANTILITNAQRLNPLSGLPGNEAINEYLGELAGRGDRLRLVSYIDISNFKPFNDKFGFELGDRAIRVLADLLKKVADITGAFVGHIGGDDFFVGADDGAVRGVLSMLETLPQHFSESVSGLVPDDVQVAGHYEGRTRSGQIRKIPLITSTIVGLTFEPGAQMPTPEAIAAKLAELKSRTRKQGKEILLPEL